MHQGLRSDSERETLAGRDADDRAAAGACHLIQEITRRGQWLAVWAIKEGRQCAKVVARYLTGADQPIPGSQQLLSTK